jgi:hypothetical protein
VAGTTNKSVQLQVYPGVLASEWVTVGAYLQASEWDGVGAGLTLALAPVVPGVLFNRGHGQEVFH